MNIEPEPQGGRAIRTAPDIYAEDMRQYVADWRLRYPAEETIPRDKLLAEVSIVVSSDQPANHNVLKPYLLGIGVKPAEFARLLKEVEIREALGRLPKNPSDFITLLAEQRCLTVQLNGMLKANERAYMDINAKSGEITRHFIDETLDISQSFVQHYFRKTIDMQEFRLDARTTAADLDLRYSAAVINDAAERWQQKARFELEYWIKESIRCDQMAREQEEEKTRLIDLCRSAFDCRETSPEYVAAAVLKFIWQVKRKLEDIPVTDHCMLVLMGLQGVGKSTFVRYLISPLKDFAGVTSFDEITDRRNIALWRKAILNLEEMGGANKADIETVKNAISADMLSRRPMGTNDTVDVQQRATFIGSSNRESLGDLIRDPTGLRRFISVRFSDTPDRRAINEYDWGRLWRSVDPRKADPMTDFRHVLKARQEEERTQCNVEVWLRDLDPRRFMDGRLTESRRVPANILFLAFSEWERDYFPASRSSQTRFGLDMAQLRLEGRCPFKKVRGPKFSYYEYEGDMGLTVVRGGREV